MKLPKTLREALEPGFVDSDDTVSHSTEEELERVLNELESVERKVSNMISKYSSDHKLQMELMDLRRLLENVRFGNPNGKIPI